MNSVCHEMKAMFAKHETVCGRVLPLVQLIFSKTRFRIICLLLRGEFCVNQIVEVVSPGQLPNVSQQLKALTLAGIIERRRVKRQIIYSLKDQRVKRLIAFLQQEFLNENSDGKAVEALQALKPGFSVHMD